jgi:hypothetical protein
MFKFIIRKTKFETIRAEDLRVGDRFIYDSMGIEVLATAKTPKNMIVDMMSTYPGTAWMRTVSIPREQFINVPR